ncbi:type VI secretion system membrane subunit TssM [Pseudomonas sp. NPDC089401]|uniref:type VI secretion system membrane subunit TssM n=1 Tax=Pseudomonas sp. NPDC089401 TaxID=3364462 RepID=UPI00380EC9C2
MNELWKPLKRWGLVLAARMNLFMPLLLVMATALLLMAIWWSGPQWTWRGHRPLASVEWRGLASVLLVVLPLLCWSMVLRSRFRRLACEREQAVAAESDPSLSFVQGQEHALNRQLANYLDKAGGLYRLPFYLVLGAGNAGKSRLVEHSGQRFSLTCIDKAQASGLKGETPAYGVSWWISDDAVFIDPPGDFITQGANPAVRQNTDNLKRPKLPTGTQAKLWMHLLGWLVRCRSRRPLNGMLLVVDLAALLHASREERMALAHQLRTRLHEVSSQLGMQLPVYVALSKVDLLDGFDRFFGQLPRSLRSQLLGFTFEVKASVQRNAWLSEFISHYAQLIERIQEHAVSGLATSMTTEERKRLLSFQAQLEGLQPILQVFLQEALASDRFTTPALVRGLYWSSAEQHGEIENAFVRESALGFKTLRPLREGRRPAPNASPFFTQQIFQHILYPEAGLAGDNIKVSQQKRRALWLGSGVSLLAIVVAGTSLHHYSTLNQANAGSVLVKSRAFSAGEVDDHLDPTGRNLLAPLQQIRDAVSVFGDYRSAWPGVADAGLYQGRAIGPMVDEAYLSLLSRRFLPALASGLVDAMEAAPAGSEQQMAALRIYRMIEDRQNRRASWVEAWMADRWQLAFPGEGQVQRDLMRHLQYAMAYADADLQPFTQRVAAVQQALRKVPLQQRLYASLKRDAEHRLQAGVDLRHQVGPAFDVIYLTAEHTRLAPLLTAKGFSTFFAPRSQQLGEMAMIDRWALGERQQPDHSDADRAALAEQLHNLYSADYIDSWQQALYQLQVTDFHDLGHAVAVLAQLTGPAAPLRRLLETVRDNTTVQPATPTDSAEGPLLAAQGLPAISHRLNQMADIRLAFAGLNETLEPKGERPSYYEETLNALKAVHDYARAVQNSPDRGRAALDAVLEQFAAKGADPIATLQRVAIGLPEPIRQQVTTVAEQTAQVLMIEALQELERRWQAEVYSFFEQRLAGRYPFRVRAEDAALDDFEAFFGPRGRLQQFQDKYLDTFLAENLSALQADNRSGALIHPGVIEQLESASRIRESFFDSRGNLSVQFSIEPLGLSANQRVSLLELAGQQVHYTHAPRQMIGVIWPNPEHMRSTLTLLRQNGNSSSLEYRGPWSMFRLLSRGGLNGRTDTTVDLTFRAGDGAMRYKLRSEKTFNPITQQPFKGFKLPRTLLDQPLQVSAARQQDALAQAQ